MGKTYDFAGWATRNDLRCADGRVIRKDAFKDNDGKTEISEGVEGGYMDIINYSLFCLIRLSEED